MALYGAKWRDVASCGVMLCYVAFCGVMWPYLREYDHTWRFLALCDVI